MSATEALDASRVSALLGRSPQGDYQIVLRRSDGWPVVIMNEPILWSGRPMPTRYWLLDRALNKAVSQIESNGGVDRCERLIGLAPIAETHAAYAAERDAALPGEHQGPLPVGGVGGTRVGVKCLHAHYAYFLIGADDPVGAWVQDQLDLLGAGFDPTVAALWPPGYSESPQQETA